MFYYIYRKNKMLGYGEILLIPPYELLEEDD